MMLLFLNLLRNFMAIGLLIKFTYASNHFDIKQKTFNDFKTLMMFFNEPLLSTASVRDFLIGQRSDKGAEFEGANSKIMSEKLAKIIKDVSSKDVDQVTKQFGQDLENGRLVLESMVLGKDDISKNAKDLQKELLKHLKSTNNRIVLPFSWEGSSPHAISLIIEYDSLSNTFDLTVVNAGDGIDYHFATKDTNKIYPLFKHSWIKFEKIPKDEIFPQNSWFMYSFIALNDRQMVEEIEKFAGSAKDYFYGSILNNFAKYMFINYSETRLIPFQRSGSCTLSSLMAALLYYSKDLSMFHKNRVIIGQEMLNQFFNNYENDNEFKRLIQDGFDLISRKLMGSTSSALAHHILLYLESSFPDSFLQAGLVGADRSNWIINKKAKAIKVIENNTNVHELVKQSVDLGLRVIKFLEDNPIKHKSTRIYIHDDTKNMVPDLKFNYVSGQNWRRSVETNVRNKLSVSILRRKFGYNNLDEIKTALDDCSNNADTYILICVRDTFEQSINPKWWNYFDNNSLMEDQIMSFLETCKNILEKYSVIYTVPNSLGDLIALAHLQIAVWKSVVKYKAKVGSSLNFANFKPPSVLQEVIKQFKPTFTSTSYLNWPIKTNFYLDDLSKLKYLLKEYSEITTGPEEFYGPSKFLLHSEDICSTKDVYAAIMSTDKNKEAYEKMLTSPSIAALIEQIRKDKYIESKSKDLVWKNGSHVALTIFLSRFKEVSKDFPQYVILMECLMYIYKRAGKSPISLGSDKYPFSRELKEHSIVKLNFNLNDSVYNSDFNFNTNSSKYFEVIENCYEIKMSSSEDIFYKLRHSQAQSELENIVGFEAWLNYVKGAPDPTIFDSPYFLYLTDHLLNFPKLQLDKNSEIVADVEKLYPSGFDAKYIKEVYQALIKIAKNELNILIVKGSQLKIEIKKQIIDRAVNITIPLVRFIGRVDHDQLISGNNAANMLSQIYVLFYDFCLLKNEYGLEEKYISQVNVLMGQICDLEIRNPKKFLELIQDTFPENPSLKSRKTLSRIHWFVARIYYSALSLGKNHSDDLFKVGQIYEPFVKDETGPMKIILKSIFASKYAFDTENVEIEFDEQGDIALLTIKENSNNVAIQLSSGKVVENGFELVEKNFIINNDIFSKYFETENDRKMASRGEITKIGFVVIYVVSDYKMRDNTIVILCDQTCQVYRKRNNGKFLLWIQDKNDYIQGVKYKWVHGYKLYVDEVEKKAFLIKDDEMEPLNVIDFSNPNSVSIEISDFFSNSSSFSLLDNDPKKHKNLERHIKYFTDTDTLLAKKNDNTLAVIYPGLRFYDYPKYPIVLVEIKANKPHSGFHIKNLSGFVISTDQIAINGVGIAGTLVAENKAKQQFILAPLSEGPGSVENLRFVERIPIADNSPAPQSRLQKLLLSFYCIKSRIFNFARKLLHPFTSIDQNEPFSKEELEVLIWIIRISDAGPETAAFKLISYMHFFNNSRKFPLYYIKPKQNDTTEEGKTKHFRSKLEEDIQKLLKKIVPIYFLSIRDLPEKYYLHRIFPEYTSEENAAIIKRHLTASLQNEDIKPGTYSIQFELAPRSGLFASLEFNLKRVDQITVTTILDHARQNNAFLDDYLRLMSKLIYRTDNKNTSTLNGNEAVIICASLNKAEFLAVADEMNMYYTEWENFFAIPDDVKNDPNFKFEFKYSSIKIEEDLVKIVKKFRADYPWNFYRYDATKGSTFTDIDKIFENLKADSKQSIEGSKELPFGFRFEPVNIIDLEEFRKIIDAISKVLNPDKSKVKAGFNEDNIRKSPVLQKLKGSIEIFVGEKGQYIATDINLSNLYTELNSFKNYLDGRINELNVDSTKMTTDLNSILQRNQSSSLIESVNRLMHHRKVKNFENLYSCYQRLSVKCIQNKFPQIEKADCDALLKESMKFYSTNVLIKFMEAIQESVDGFLKKPHLQSTEFVAVDDLTLFLDEAGKVEDFNTRLRTPSILNFEYRSKRFRLRTEQVKDIDNLTSIDPKTGLFNSVVIQRMMAAGKTLVLGTISVVKKALDDTKLSILVPPTSLYQSNLSDMQARTYKFFKTKGDNFIFPRFEFGDEYIKGTMIPFLKFILGKIENMKKFRDYFVLSPDTLQTFLNSYIEMINYHTNIINEFNKTNYVIIDALKLYAKIYNIFRTEGSIILDEIDMTMDPKKELNFPTAESEPLNMIAATLMTDLIEFSIFDREVINLGLDILGNNQSALTAENYEKYRKILFKYISKQFGIKTSIWSENLLEPNLEDLNSEAIMNFLQIEDIDHMSEWMERIHKADRAIVGNALIIIKIQLWKYLKEAMKSTANLNFGPSGPSRPGTEYAIPYLAANTPSPSSEFSNRWETLNKTLLMLASISCTEIIAKKMIGYVRSRIVEETSLKVKMKGTATYKNITTLIPQVDPLALDDKDPGDIETVHIALKTRSPTAIRLLFSYALDEIFSQMKFPVEQITSNALNMTSMFGSVQGYSGTIDNVNILPREVVDGAYINHMENEKNNGGIALKLMKDSKDPNSGENKAVYQIPDDILKKDVKTIVDTMIKLGLPDVRERNSVSALIDTGAFFKNSKNVEVAEAILEVLSPRITTVLYYDEDSNQVKFKKKTGTNIFESGSISSTIVDSIDKDTQTKIENRFTFYDQRHITGSDILQPKTACALMTVGTRVLLRDILQGTLRMRQFMTSQKVHLITSSSAANFYYSKSGAASKGYVDVSDMISLGAFNEDEKQFTENEKLVFTKIDNEVRRFVLDEITRAILNSYKAAQIIPLWFRLGKEGTKNIRDLFIRLIKEIPLGWMVKSVKKDTADVIKRYSEFWIEKIKETSDSVSILDSDFSLSSLNTKSSKNFVILKDALKVMTTIVNNDDDPKTKHLLPGALKSQITDRVFDQDGGGEVEMQVFNQHLAEVDIDKLVISLSSSPKMITRNSFKLDSLTEKINDATEFRDIKYFAVNLRDVLFNTLFSGDYLKFASSALMTTGKRLAVSKDLIQIAEFNPQSLYQIFSEYSWEGSHILIQVLPEKKGIRAILLSTESAREVRDSLKSGKTDFKGSTFWLCDLSGSIGATNDDITTIYMNILDLMPSSRILFFDLLIFNGSINHILTNKFMKKIYYEKWFKHDNYKYRALFLLLRMRVLANKSKYIMAENSMDMTILNRAARGDKDIFRGIKLSSGAYKKSPIDDAVESEYFASIGKKRPAPGKVGRKTKIKFNDIYQDITSFAPPVLSKLNELSIISFSQDIPVTEDNDICLEVDDGKLDFFDEENRTSKMVKYWLDVIDNVADINDYVADPPIIRSKLFITGPNGTDNSSGTGKSSGTGNSSDKKKQTGSNNQKSTRTNLTEANESSHSLFFVVIVVFGIAGFGYIYIKKVRNSELDDNFDPEKVPEPDENGDENDLDNRPDAELLDYDHNYYLQDQKLVDNDHNYFQDQNPQSDRGFSTQPNDPPSYNNITKNESNEFVFKEKDVESFKYEKK